jgi:hypothetical protein
MVEVAASFSQEPCSPAAHMLHAHTVSHSVFQSVSLSVGQNLYFPFRGRPCKAVMHFDDDDARSCRLNHLAGRYALTHGRCICERATEPKNSQLGGQRCSCVTTLGCSERKTLLPLHRGGGGGGGGGGHTKNDRASSGRGGSVSGCRMRYYIL